MINLNSSSRNPPTALTGHAEGNVMPEIHSDLGKDSTVTRIDSEYRRCTLTPSGVENTASKTNNTVGSVRRIGNQSAVLDGLLSVRSLLLRVAELAIVFLIGDGSLEELQA